VDLSEAVAFDMKWINHFSWRRKSRGRKSARPELDGVREIDPARIRERAEHYYRSRELFCSEAVVKAIVEGFRLPVPDLVVAMASGFPLGMGGAGCTCGALAGGVMALGLFFGRTEAKDRKRVTCMQLSKALHDHFRDRHQAVCCRVLTKGMRFGFSRNREQCVSLAGEIAEETAKIILGGR